MKKRRLTDEGVEVLETYSKNLKNLMFNKIPPFQCRIFGFPLLTVKNRDELYGRIKMVDEILSVEKEVIKSEN